MPLFEAPGWDDGGTMVIPDSSTKKKRRRPSNASDSFVNNEDPQSTDVNLDRLMKKMRLGRNNTGSSIGKIDGRKPSSATGRRAGLKRKKGGDSTMSITTEIDPASNDQMDVGESQKSQSQIHGRIKRSKRASTLPTEGQVGGPGITSGVSESTSSIPTNATFQVEVASDQTEKKEKKKKKKQKNIEIGPISDEPLNEADGKATSNPTLTSMQASMKQKLDGGKFRYINEILYKSDSKSALQMLQDDPTVFEE
ncbi:25S rRNA (adenine645-N1)-methyltransferase, partial [Tulasnella sp. 419]